MRTKVEPARVRGFVDPLAVSPRQTVLVDVSSPSAMRHLSGDASRRGFRWVLAACALQVSLFAHGDDGGRRYDIDIRETDAPAALKELAEQTESLLLFPFELAQDRRANPVAGRYTIEEALARLLDGSGLAGVLTNQRVISVVREEPPVERGEQMAAISETTVPPAPRRSSLLRRVGATLAAVLATPGISAVESADDDSIEVIIVTAEKREEDILDVPLTLSAFNDQAIEEFGMTADEDLENLVPGLQFGYDYEGQGVSMRGIGTHSAVINQADTSVAFYVDGVYSYKHYGIAPNMFDLARIEVARGPQGTLNGRNSIAGAVSYVTQRPTDTWDVDVLAEFTDQVTQRYGLAFGGPINDNWSFRLTGSYYGGDGAQENVGSGGDYDQPDQRLFSPQIRFTTDRLDANLRYSDLVDEGTSRAWVRMSDRPRDVAKFIFFGFWEVPNPFYLYDKAIPSIANCDTGYFPSAGEGGTFNGLCQDLENKVLSNRENQQESGAERWSFHADFELTENLTLRYTFGDHVAYRFKSNDSDKTDREPSAANQTIPNDLTDPADIALWVEEEAEFRDTEDAWFENDEERSHELQVFSAFDGPFNFVAGVYAYENHTGWQDRQQNWASPTLYMNAEEAVRFIDWDQDGAADWSSCDDFYNNFVLAEDDEETEFVEGLGEDPAETWGCAEGSDHTWKTGGGAGSASESKAVFVSGEYQINEQWQVSGGLRWLEDEKRIVAEIGNGDHGVYGYLVELDDENLLPGHPVPWGGVPLRAGQVVTPATSSWSATIGHVSVEYTPTDDLLYYARLSTGFRAGGFNESGILDLDEDPEDRLVDPTFPSEELVNYEVGIKGRFLDRRLTLMAGAYLEDFERYHLNTVQLIPDNKRATAEEPFEEYTAAAPGTDIWGIEVEGSLIIDENWRLAGFYNLLESSFGPHRAFFDFESIIGIEPEEPPETFEHTFLNRETGEQETVTLELPRDVTGNRLPQQPKHKGAVSLHYTRSLDQAGVLSAITTWSYTGAKYPDESNLYYTEIPAYDRWDFRTTWESANAAWTVTGFVQNILDEIAVQDMGPGGDLQAWLTEHRRIGLQVRWRPEF